MEKQKRKLSKLTVLFYALAMIMGAYTFFTVYQSYVYVNGLVTSSQLSVSENLADIIQYFVTNSFQYLFYAIVFGFFGYVVTIIRPVEKTSVIEEVETVVDEEDWFEEPTLETMTEETSETIIEEAE